MFHEKCSTDTTRREFLKKTCKTTGYVLPVMFAFKLGSRDAWACDYGKDKDKHKPWDGKRW